MLYNVREVHRPTDIGEAVKLLRRKKVRTVALAGGTALVGEGGPDIEAIVDLDGLGLDKIERRAEVVTLGATARLQTIVDELGDIAGGLLAEAAHRMAGWHVRNAATLGGTLFTAPPSAPLLPLLSALGAEVTLYAPKKSSVGIANFLAQRDGRTEDGALLTEIHFEVPPDAVGFGFAHVGRTPADDPIVCAIARAGDDAPGVWLGGVGPSVVALPGDDMDVLHDTIAALPELPSDFLGSAEYRADIAAVLAHRALAQARAHTGDA
jgi:CO/xanthine dehydrogenase FAD-binding subunit